MQPIDSDTMAEMLSTSVWRVSTYEKFKADAAIESNFQEFYNEFLTYDSNVDELYALFCGRRSQKYFPGRVDLEAKDGTKDKGLMQYYWEGTPCYKWCKNLWKKMLPEDKRKKYTATMDIFRDKFKELLSRLNDKLRKDAKYKNIFDTRKDVSAPKKPEAFGSGKNPRSSLHNMVTDRAPKIVQSDPDWQPDWDSDEDDEPYPQETDENIEAKRSKS